MNYAETAECDVFARAEMQADTFEEFLAALQRLDLELEQLDDRTWEFNYMTIERSTTVCVRRQSEHVIWVWENRELRVTEEGLEWQQVDSVPTALGGKFGSMSMSSFLDGMVTGYFIEKAQDI